MQQPKNPRGRPRLDQGEKLERLVLYAPRDVIAKVKANGQEWARAVLRRARDPKPKE